MIGNRVTRIGDYAFSDCTALTGVNFKGNAPNIGGSVFFVDNGTSSATVYYLSGTWGWGPTFGGRPTAVWGVAEFLGTILAQHAGTGQAGLCPMNVGGTVGPLDPLFEELSMGWTTRDLDTTRLLVQQGDGGAAYIVPLNQAVEPDLAQAKKISNAIPGLKVVAVDNQRVLAQLGDGGPGFLAAFDANWNMSALTRIQQDTTRMSLRSLDGDNLLVQAAPTGAGYIWRLGADGAVSSTVQIYNGALRGLILRSVSGPNVLVQLGEVGPAFIATFDQDWKLISVTPLAVTTTGWAVRALD